MRGYVRKIGNSWYYSFELGSIDGRRRRLERVAEGATTKKEALAILRQKIAEYEDTGSVFVASTASLHDYMDFWMREYVELKLAPNTQYNYESCLRLHILPALGDQRLKSLSPEKLQKFVNDMARQGFAKQTISIMMGILNKALNHAVHPYQLIKDNPMRYVELIMLDDKARNTRESLKIQSMDNLRALSEHFNEDHVFYIPFQIGLHTGMRIGEVCGLEWRHVDFDRMIIKVEQQMSATKVNGNSEWIIKSPKSKSGYRTIPIGNGLLEILRKERTRQKKNQLYYGQHYIRPELGDFICRKESGDFIPPGIAKHYTRQAAIKLEIDFNFHSLRHTHATMLVEQGVPTKAIQKRLGHSRAAVTVDKYVHLTEKMSREAADVFDSITSNL